MRETGASQRSRTSQRSDVPEPGVTTIDCDDCIMQHTSACADCVVTFICSREPGEAVIVDVDELRALRQLSRAGLVPELRHRLETG